MTHMTHILIIEDDPAIAMTLRFALEREGFGVSWADTVAKVSPHLDVPRLDAVVLDVGLPDGDGFGVCRMIRQGDRHANVPILFLTARTDEVERVFGLELGADDYIAKPFSPKELIARIKAIFRRQELTIKTTQAHSDPQKPADFSKTIANQHWHYQACDYTLFLNQHALPLSKTELSIMLTLLDQPNHILTREQILASVSDHPEHRLSRTIDSHIKTLRQKLGEVCDDEIIVTHRGLGYGLC